MMKIQKREWKEPQFHLYLAVWSFFGNIFPCWQIIPFFFCFPGVYISKYSDCLHPSPWHQGKSGFIVICKLIKVKPKSFIAYKSNSKIQFFLGILGSLRNFFPFSLGLIPNPNSSHWKFLFLFLFFSFFFLMLPIIRVGWKIKLQFFPWNSRIFGNFEHFFPLPALWSWFQTQSLTLKISLWNSNFWDVAAHKFDGMENPTPGSNFSLDF